jgi:antitoxin component YwqK of YwqJK toxin-antitoxin module
MHTNETDDYIYFGESPSKDTKYYGKVYYKNGISYHGYLLNRLKNGYGELHESNGNYKKGNFLNDRLNGQGIFFNKESEAYYIGNFTNGKLDGLITCFYDKRKKIVKKNYEMGIPVKEHEVQPIVKEVDAVEKPIAVRKIIIKKPTMIISKEIINKYS